MYTKVLIAEDHEMATISVQKKLNELGIGDAQYVYYCDHALAWIKNALRDGQPYDLLITDLEFEEDHNKQELQNGLELIKAVKQVQPNIKVITLTGRDFSSEIRRMMTFGLVDGYVRKARKDAQHLRAALEATYANKKYQSPDDRKTTQQLNAHEFTTLDLHIVKLLFEGVAQKQMPVFLEQRSIKPNSLSSIEKRLSLMREVLGFNNNEQLAIYCKEKGLI